MFYFFQRLRQIGAFVTTTEAILLQLLGGRGETEEAIKRFQTIQKIIKEEPPNTGLLPSASL